tara:strand:- start:503 stop:1300 length:798 start_codon:yes stop_codon:yes gene_type:complete
MIGRAVSALIKRILRQGKAAKPWGFEASSIPHKSPGMPGVATRSSAMDYVESAARRKGILGEMPVPDRLVNPQVGETMKEVARLSRRQKGIPLGVTPGSPEWRRIMERKVMDKVARIERSVPFERYNYPQSFYPKAEIRDRILKMRKSPGIARGLQRLESRKASALSSGGRGAMGAGRSAKPARALRYEPSTKRSFANMLRTDKNFEEFVIDSVGIQNVSKVMNNSRIRKQLMLQYEKWGAKGHPRTLGEFNEMDVGIDKVIDLS